MTKKLLITGASGFLGWYLCRLAVSLGWDVHGTSYTKAHGLDFVTWHHLDLTDEKAVVSLMHTLQPDAVIHAAAMGRPNDCQTDPEGSYAINVEATAHLARLCQALERKLVFISTEQVFDGEHPPYQETDPVSPINLYGEHKRSQNRRYWRHRLKISFVECR
ncbi:MAG: sugar nucleotide-binding protein [Acaryochloridaceae cyanobacterium RL_2_7]|nr:sugar nucleotide-binding protein [Acaryochloridaceae cyanobacterium RL_2_7]